MALIGQELRTHSLVKVHSAHPHRIATYDERGVQTTGGEVVLVLTDFCPGGTVEEYLRRISSRGATDTVERPISSGNGGTSGLEEYRDKTTAAIFPGRQIETWVRQVPPPYAMPEGLRQPTVTIPKTPIHEVQFVPSAHD